MEEQKPIEEVRQREALLRREEERGADQDRRDLEPPGGAIVGRDPRPEQHEQGAGGPESGGRQQLTGLGAQPGSS